MREIAIPPYPGTCKHARCVNVTLGHTYCVRHFAEHGEYSKVTLVCGPPGSGKSHFVRGHLEQGDLVLDLDTLYCALSGLQLYERADGLLPFVCEARDAILDRLARPNDVHAAWVIACAPSKEERDKLRWRFYARSIILPVRAEICLARIEAQRRAGAQDWPGLVAEWWDRYQSSPDDVVIDSGFPV